MNDIITDIFAMTRALYPEARIPERPKSHRVLYPALPPERPLYPDQPGYQKPEVRIPETPMPKWTPGPWRMLRDDTGGEFTGWPSIEALPAADLTIIHRAGFKQEFWGDLSQREAIANARLIAAAPELYEALVAMLREPPETTSREHYALRDKARAALAKARGE